MCKIFAMSNMAKVKLTPGFINTVRREVCKSDNDGFGYAVLGQDGALGGERTIRPESFRPLEFDADSVTKKLPIVLETDNCFGVIDFESPKAFVAHGRYSTNSVSLANTHPFTNDTSAMIHNGVVYDGTKLLTDLKTDNDTEVLFQYWQRGGMDAIEENVSGYYAFVILDTDGTMHVVRDSSATLFVSYCSTVDSYIFATTKDIIINVARDRRWKIERPCEVTPNTYALFNGNELVQHDTIDPCDDMPAYMMSAAQVALGRTASPDTRDWRSWTEQAPETASEPSYRELAEFDMEMERAYGEDDAGIRDFTMSALTKKIA